MTILSEKGKRCPSHKGKDIRMRAIICDDDGHFAKRFEQSVTRFYRDMGISIDVIVATNPKELLSRSDLTSFDIAFLDADMKPIDGIEVGRALKKQKPEMIVVFVSAYLEFAPKGYTIDAFRHILKQDIQNTLPLCLSDVLQQIAPGCAILSYKQHGETFRIPCHDIVYIQSNLRKLNVFGINSLEPIVSFYGKFSDYTPSLSDQGFLQINKSTLVNMVYIKSIASYHVYLSNGVLMNASKNGYAAIKNRYLEWRGAL